MEQVKFSQQLKATRWISSVSARKHRFQEAFKSGQANLGGPIGMAYLMPQSLQVDMNKLTNSMQVLRIKSLLNRSFNLPQILGSTFCKILRLRYCIAAIKLNLIVVSN